LFNPTSIAQETRKSGFSSSESASLVNIANIPSANKKTSKVQLNRELKFRRLDHAQKLLIDANIMNRSGTQLHRTCTCHKKRNSTGEQPTIRLSIDQNDSQSTLGNVQTCGSLWTCPVCYERKALEEGQKILKAIQANTEAGLVPMMIALTASHSRKMTLRYSKDTFKIAWNAFNAHRQWKKFKKDFHVKHVISNVDITYGLENGWHYHKHLLLFLDASQIDLAEAFLAADDILTSVWLNQLENKGRSATSEHGLHVSDRHKSANDYMAKIGITVQDNGKLHYEMTSAKTKDSFTIWDILAESEHGSQWASKLYIEYASEMSGNNWIQYGRTGLQDIIANYEPGETEPEQETMKNWLRISDYWWDIIKWSQNGISRILTIASRTRDIHDIREELHKMRIELIKEHKLSDYYRDYIPIVNSISDVQIHEDWKNE